MATSNLENKTIFDKIDTFFSSKKSSEATLLYIGSMLIVAALVYQFVYLETDKRLKLTESKLTNVTKKISEANNYLAVNTKENLQKLKNEVHKMNIEYDNTIYKISYVDNTLTELSYLLFDDENWASFVDNISHLAKKHSIHIKEIGNKFYDPTFQKITQVVEVEVKSVGSFTNMLKFLNEIEESKLVIDVNSIEITKPDERLQGKFKIAVWGMKY